MMEKEGIHFLCIFELYVEKGRTLELLEALEAMIKDNQPIPSRAMIKNKKYRTLVSAWIEPLNEEAELGHEIDYIARYIAEGGLTGERKRWVPRSGKTPLDHDASGFIYNHPIESLFKQRCLEESKIYHRKLLKLLQNEGPATLGDASEYDYMRVVERLKKIIKGPEQSVLKPKVASKMTVSELKEELEAQELPIDGTRNVLYQGVQKARRINRSRGRPLWVPPVEEEEEEVDEELDELISRIQLQEGNTEFWKRRFLGEGVNGNHVQSIDVVQPESELADELDDADTDAVEDVAKEGEEDEADEEEVEQTESPDGERVKDKLETEAKKLLQMIGVQLLKDSDQLASPKKSKRRSSRVAMEVIELGGTPTVGDCALILRAAILKTKTFIPLYDEVITLCLDLTELDAVVAIVAEMESSGITVPDKTLDKVISAKQTNDSSPESTSDEASS